MIENITSSPSHHGIWSPRFNQFPGGRIHLYVYGVIYIYIFLYGVILIGVLIVIDFFKKIITVLDWEIQASRSLKTYNTIVSTGPLFN
jgi:hypothetical protein